MSFAVEGSGIVTDAAVMSAGDARQSTMSAVRLAHGLASVFTLPVENVLRPNFGTRYFMPITWLVGLGIANAVNFICLLVSLARSGGTYLGIGPIGSTIVLLGFLALTLYHARRIWRLMNNMGQEYDSELPGPGLALFAVLPRGGDYLALRCIYEPAAVFVCVMVAALLQILNPFAALYYVFCGLALSLKGFCTWYLAWNHWRDIADRVHRAPTMEQFAMGVAPDTATAPVTPPTPAFAAPALAPVMAFSVSQLPREAQMLLTETNRS